MKKQLMVFAVVLLAVAIALPAFAAVEFKYGGQFRVRYVSQNNVLDGTEMGVGTNFDTYNGNDNRNFIDQRLRLYFSFVASKNLKVVWKIEMGDAIWGASANTSSRAGNTGANAGGNVGADAVSIEVKNAYVEFNIPNTPTTALVGIQTLTLLDSWIVDDDFASAVLVTKLDPFKISVGYVGGQNGWEQKVNPTGQVPTTDSTFDVDSWFAAVDWKDGPFKASLIGFVQNAHHSDVTVNPATMETPVRDYTGAVTNAFGTSSFINGASRDTLPSSNLLFDLGVNFTYKVDWLLAYVNFVKNFGSVDAFNPFTGLYRSLDYRGYMFDAGVTYFCGPYTANIGGFYTTGPDVSSDPAQNGNTFRGLASRDVNWFVYPLATAKYFSEIIGGGVIGDDLYAYRGASRAVTGAQMGHASGLNTVYWRGYGFPTNLWTVTAGGSWQIAEQTKISGSYWYFGTSNKVPVSFRNDGSGLMNMSSSIGHELDFYVDQGIVDGLTLTLVGAYLFADDAFAPLPLGSGSTTAIAQDAYEVGARLQWNF